LRLSKYARRSDGKEIPLGESAVALYKIRTSKKPGKHFIPGTIEFTDQDGKTQRIAKPLNTWW